jgi:hypothetical protein
MQSLKNMHKFNIDALYILTIDGNNGFMIE